MAATNETERQRAVTQIFANWRIEGFVPDADYLALLDAYVRGALTLEQLCARTNANFEPRDRTATCVGKTHKPVWMLSLWEETKQSFWEATQLYFAPITGAIRGIRREYRVLNRMHARRRRLAASHAQEKEDSLDACE